jgi:hypothetical protein
MQDGNHSSIRYKASDDRPRRGSLTETDINVPLPKIGQWSTKDSQWEVSYDNGTTTTVKWMHFRATDGKHRKVRIACEGGQVQTQNGPVHRIVCDFVYANPDGSDEHREHQIYFIDPDDQLPYRVIINDVFRPYPVRPVFHVDHT